MDTRYKRLGKNTAFVFIGNAGSKLIGLLMLPFYTHYLTTATYGISDLISTYATIMVSVISCCLADAIFVFPKNASKKSRKQFFTSGIAFSIISFVLWAVIAFFIGEYGEGTIASNVWWIYAVTLTMFLQGYFQQFIRSIDKMLIFSLIGIVNVVCLTGFSFLLLPKFGLNGYLLSIVFSNLAAFIFSFAAARLFVYLDIHCFSWTHLLELLKYGVPLIPNTIMWWIVNGINRPIMEANIGLDAVGIYAVANKLPGVITMLFAIFSNAWTITLLEEFGKPDFNYFFNKTVKALFFFLSLCTVFMIVGSKLIVRVFAAPNFFDAWRYVPVLSVGILLSCVSGLIGGIFAAEKKSKYFFYSSIWGAVSSLLFTIIGVKLFGLMGICIAVVVSFLCMTIVRLFYAWHHINEFNLRYYSLMFLLIVVSCVVMVEIETVLIKLIFESLVLIIMLVINREETRGLLRIIQEKVFNKHQQL